MGWSWQAPFGSLRRALSEVLMAAGVSPIGIALVHLK